MEIRELALRIVTTEALEVKLTPPAPPGTELTDDQPGPALRVSEPGRPANLRMIAGPRAKAPGVAGMGDPAQRPRILHALANHELQAVELFAWALLAFPQAPGELRRGLLRVLLDEQRHTRMYIARVEANGARFGDFPVNGYFWKKTPALTSPLRFLCAMSLTFENANLDHTLDYGAAAKRAGDDRTAAVIERVHRDEIEHVRLGWTWLQRLKGDDEAAWPAFAASLSFPLQPARARGRTFHRAPREAAGLDPEFIQQLEKSRQ